MVYFAACLLGATEQREAADANASAFPAYGRPHFGEGPLPPPAPRAPAAGPPERGLSENAQGGYYDDPPHPYAGGTGPVDTGFPYRNSPYEPSPQD